MVVTEQSLIDEFDRREIPLNKRVLTDWRRKGYLPPLRVKGLGQGKGKRYFWSEAKVIDRALLVDEALNSGYRGSKLLFILWLFGHDIPSNLIRDHLVAGLSKVATITRGERQARGAIEEHIEDLTAKYYQIAARYPEIELPHDMPAPVMEMILNVFVNPTYDLHDAPFEDGITASIEVELKRDSASSGMPAPSRADRVRDSELMWRFVYERFSLSHMQEAVINATARSLHQVQSDIGVLFAFVRQQAAGKPQIEKLLMFRIQAAYSLGMLLAVVDLTMRCQGLGHVIDKGLSQLRTQNTI